MTELLQLLAAVALVAAVAGCQPIASAFFSTVEGIDTATHKRPTTRPWHFDDDGTVVYDKPDKGK